MQNGRFTPWYAYTYNHFLIESLKLLLKIMIEVIANYTNLLFTKLKRQKRAELTREFLFTRLACPRVLDEKWDETRTRVDWRCTSSDKSRLETENWANEWEIRQCCWRCCCRLWAAVRLRMGGNEKEQFVTLRLHSQY